MCETVHNDLYYIKFVGQTPGSTIHSHNAPIRSNIGTTFASKFVLYRRAKM